MSAPFPIIVAGIGNPLLRDDTAGLHALAAVEKRAAGMDGVVFKQLFCGGFDLLGELVSFSRAFIIDCLCDGRTKPGEYRRFSISSDDYRAGRERPLAASHGIDLATVLLAGARCGYPMPDPVVIYGIGASDVCVFDEQPSPAVSGAIERVADRIFSDLSHLAIIRDGRK